VAFAFAPFFRWAEGDGDLHQRPGSRKLAAHMAHGSADRPGCSAIYAGKMADPRHRIPVTSKRPWLRGSIALTGEDLASRAAAIEDET